MPLNATLVALIMATPHVDPFPPFGVGKESARPPAAGRFRFACLKAGPRRISGLLFDRDMDGVLALSRMAKNLSFGAFDLRLEKCAGFGPGALDGRAGA